VCAMNRAASPGVRARLCLSVLLASVGACDLAYPEVVVVNQTAGQIQLRSLSFNGCAWDVVLAYGESTFPGRCLPGEDRVHFRKLDTARSSTASVCPLTEESGDVCAPNSSTESATWFNYQTRASHKVNYGDFRLIHVTLDAIEQDFSIPGPYGH